MTYVHISRRGADDVRTALAERGRHSRRAAHQSWCLGLSKAEVKARLEPIAVGPRRVAFRIRRVAEVYRVGLGDAKKGLRHLHEGAGRRHGRQNQKGEAEERDGAAAESGGQPVRLALRKVR